MYEWLSKKGVIFETKKVRDLEELDYFDVVVNCTGVGAKHLVKDNDIRPISGHVLRVEAPWIKTVMAIGDAYIIPK